jgi:hypothetical protein
MKVKTLTEKVEAMICKGFFVQNVDCTKRSYNHSVESYRHDFCRKDVYWLADSAFIKLKSSILFIVHI